MDEALSFESHQTSPAHSKLPAVLDTPRSSVGSTSEQPGARPKVKVSPGRTRQVPASYMTISCNAQYPVSRSHPDDTVNDRAGQSPSTPSLAGRTAAGLNRRVTDRAYMNLYLADRLEPGEEIVADVKVFSGPGLSWDLLPLAITVAGAYEALHNLTGPSSQAPPVLFSLASVLAAGWVLVAIRIRKSFYLAATGHRLVIVRATRRGVPAGVLASLQLESVALKTGHSLNRPAFVIAAASGGAIPAGPA
jgi:hypothetical protein